MASRTTTDPIEILLEMGIDLDNLSEEEDYLSALKEAIATILYKTKGKGNEQSRILLQEVVKVRKGRKAADPKFKAKKTKVSGTKLIGTSTIVPKKTTVKKESLLALPSAIEEDESTQQKQKKKRKPKEKNLLAEIAKSVTNIADILKDQYKLKKKEGEFDRKKAQRDKRKLQEAGLEKRFQGLFKTAQKIIEPVRSLFDKIFGFLFNVLLAKFLTKIVDWIANPENQKKIQSIIRFFGDHWKKLLSLYLVFGTGLGKFVLGLSKLLITGAVKLGIAVAKLAAAKGVGGARKLARMLGGKKAKFLIGATSTALTVGGTMMGVNALTGGDGQKTQGFSGGGLAQPKIQPTPQAVKKDSSKGMSSAMKGAALGSMFGPLGALAGAGIGSLFDKFGKKDDTITLSKPASVELEVPSGTEGEVDGPGGTDKVPAMLTAGEFVMSRGAVQKFGVKQLEAMNAAGGGTNKPKVVDNKVLASVGGYVDVPGMKFDTRTGTPLVSKLTDPSFYGRAFTEAGKITGFDRLPGVIREAQKMLSSGINYAGRVGGEAQRMVQPTIDRVIRSGGEVKNVVNQKVSGTVEGAKSIINNIMNQDYGGMIDSVKNMYGAAEEAVPALLGGVFGMDRVDKHISKDMQRAILDAKKTAEARGSKNIDYGDYEGGGLSAAGLTMGRVGDQEFKRDAQGRIIGLTQTFDTNRPAEESMLQAQIAATKFLGIDNTSATNKLRDLITTRMKSEGASPEEIKNAIKYVKPGGDAGNVKDAARAIYKPFEALLDTVQGRGTTTHDVMFDKDVLGFDPVEAPPKPGNPNYQLFKDGGGMAALSKGLTVGQIVDKGRSAQNVNPIKEFLGISKSKSTGEVESSPMPVKRNRRGRPIPTAINVAPQNPNVLTPQQPPANNIQVISVGGNQQQQDKSNSDRGGSQTPQVNAGSGDQGKFKIFGIPMPF